MEEKIAPKKLSSKNLELPSISQMLKTTTQ